MSSGDRKKAAIPILTGNGSDAGTDTGSGNNNTNLGKSEPSASHMDDDSFFAGVNPNDVLLGRGKKIYNHSGNKRLRGIVNSRLRLLNAAPDEVAQEIVVLSHAQQIVDMLENDGSRFLQRDAQSGEWNVASAGKARACVLRITYFDSRFRKWQPKEIVSPNVAIEVESKKSSGREDNPITDTRGNKNKSTPPAKSSLAEPSSSGVRPLDVLLGRGKLLRRHIGNKWLHELVSSKISLYANPSKARRRGIIYDIVNMFKNQGNRFLRRDQTGVWKEVDEHVAVTKVIRLFKQKYRSCSARGRVIDPLKKQKSYRQFSTFHDTKKPSNDFKQEPEIHLNNKTPTYHRIPPSPELSAKPSPTTTMPPINKEPLLKVKSSCGCFDEPKQGSPAPSSPAMARKLPPELEQAPVTGDSLAAIDTSTKSRSISSQEEEDRQLALMLSSEEAVGMPTTNTGRALSFVQRVLRLVAKLNPNVNETSGHGGPIQPVANDMVYLTERLLNTQELFLNEARPYKIDLGYHYTKRTSLATIKTDGLLTKSELMQHDVAPSSNGGTGGKSHMRRSTFRRRLGGGYFGNGVYTANNPFTFQKFGDVGLLVARLKGWCLERGRKRLNNDNEAHGYNTIIGNKRPRYCRRPRGLPYEDSVPPEDYDEIVLRTSAQTLPLLQFPTSIIPRQVRGEATNTKHPIERFQTELQGLVDEYFNTPRQLSSGPWPSGAVEEQEKPAISRASACSRLEPTPIGPSGMSPSSPIMPFPSSMLTALLSPPSPPPAAAAAAAAFPPPAQSHAAASPSSNPFPSRRPISPSGMVPFSSSLPSVGSPTTVGAVMNWASPKKKAPLPLKSSSSPKKPPPLPPLPPLPPSLLALPVTPAPAPAVPPPNTNGSTVTGGSQQPQRQQQKQMPQQRVRYNLRVGRYSFIGGRNRNHNVKTYVYTAPDELRDTSKSLDTISQPRPCGPVEDCPICLDPMLPLSHPDGAWFPSCKLKPCGHGVHIKCLVGVMAVSNKCPICRICLGGPPQGHSPSGTMEVTKNPHSKCDGHPEIKICYILQGGTQKAYHDNPGVPYRNERREAYLPDTPDGNRLLRRLIYAFRHGLTFRVGTSLTTGRKNCITWASIHHKTSRHGGVHGYPDPSYFMNCNDELDRLNVPTDPPVPKDPPTNNGSNSPSNDNKSKNLCNLKSP